MQTDNLISDIEIVREMDSLTLNRHWRSYEDLFVIVVSIFLLIVFLFIFKEEFVNTSNIWPLYVLSPWFAYVFYFWCARLVNITTYQLDKDSLQISQAPLPFHRKKIFSLSPDVKFVMGIHENMGRSLRTFYSVDIHLVGQGRFLLEKNIPKQYQAEIIVDELNRFLSKRG